MSSWRDAALELAGAYASSGAIRAELKTNLGPPVTLYAGDDGRPSLLESLGFKAAVIIYRDGVPIASTGEPPATDPLVATAAALALAFGLGFLVSLVRRL